MTIIDPCSKASTFQAGNATNSRGHPQREYNTICSRSTISAQSVSAWRRPTPFSTGRMVRSPSLRRLITAPSSRSATGSSARRFSAPRVTGSATVASTSVCAIAASFATSVASLSPAPKSAVSAWATSSWPRQSATSGSSRAHRAA